MRAEPRAGVFASTIVAAPTGLAAAGATAGHALGQEDAPADDGGGRAGLAAAAQNPIAAMVNLPFQNNTFFRTGPDNDTANVLNIRAVTPSNLGDWNVVTRTIIPAIYLPGSADTSRAGQCDNVAGRRRDGPGVSAAKP